MHMQQEHGLAHDIARRIVLGAACRVAANDPSARVHKPVHEALQELEKRRRCRPRLSPTEPQPQQP